VRFTASDAEVRRGSFQGRISGGLTVSGTVAEPRVAGRFNINNGRVRVATKTFTIQDGSSITVAYQPASPEMVALGGARIRLDVEATTHITTYSEFDQSQQSYLITVTLTGPLDNPTLDFRSDPPDLSRQQILASLGYQAQIEALLHGGAGGDRAFRQGLAEAFTGVLVPTLFEPIEFAVMRALGLEDFALTYDFNSAIQVQFTKHLMGKFYATYQRQLTGIGQEYQLKFYYRLTPRINLSYTTDDRNIQTWAVEGRLRF
jgi:autotransporter translocation and assembly factor TamB